MKIAAIKVSEPGTSLFYTEAVVCGFMFAAEKGIEVTNNSYYVDPWLFNCKSDDDQKALVEAIGRATKYAERKGTLHVASAGNSNQDLAADSLVDETSPNDTTPVPRTIDPKVCLDLPTQLPGVVTVSATGDKGLRSYYSSYGLGVVDVAAPAATSGRSRTPRTRTAACCPPSRAGRTATSRAPRWPPRTSRASPRSSRAPTRRPRPRSSRPC